eukprot:c271_g1_i1.p1 GENE.c271_g1_i1~~c271_g1_i1.p1  ORF type:complete len:855 (+),score=156.17 c271_g1_i1:98-2566(+)
MSVDVSRDNQRLATAGFDKEIRIWKFEAITSSANVEQSQALLAILTHHTGVVNCVRWSPDSSLLCSGSDDKMVAVWRRQALTARPRGNLEGNVESKEHWTVFIRLTHHWDVTGVEWSPDGSLVASSDMQGHVNVWNIQHSGEKVHSFGRESPVKGLSWDPIGRYLAAQDEQSVVVWNLLDGTVAKSFSSAFDKCSSSVFFERLSWSPDGHYICAVNALNESVCVAPLITRSDIIGESRPQKPLFFVGHTKPVLCSRWNPRLFRYNSDMTQLCAIASKDCSVSIWMAGDSKPILVMKEMFAQSVLDISWSFDGLTLVLCGYDGKLGWITFEPHGRFQFPLSIPEMDAYLQTQFGADYGTRSTANIPESPALLLDATPNTDSKPPSPKRARLMPSDQPPAAPPAIAAVPVTQSESRTQSGKRRIQPMVLSAPSDAPAPPFGSNSSSIAPGSAPPTLIPTSGWQGASVPLVSPAPTLLPIPTAKRKDAQPGEPYLTVRLKEDSTSQAQCCSEQGCLVVSVTRQRQQVWAQRLGIQQAASQLHMSPRFVAVSTTVGDLHLFVTDTGQRLVSPIRLKSPLSYLGGDGPAVIAVTRCGFVTVYKLDPVSCAFSESATEILAPPQLPQDGESASQVSVLSIDRALLVGERRVPMLLLSDGSGHCYSERMRGWVCIASVSDMPLYPASKFAGLSPAAVSSDQPLHLALAHSTQIASKKRALELSRAHHASTTTDSIGHAEFLMRAAIELSSIGELSYWSRKWVEMIAVNGDAVRLESWLNALSRETKGLIPNLKEFLIKDIVPIVSRCAALHRVMDTHLSTMDEGFAMLE